MVDGSPRPGGEIPFSPHNFSPGDAAAASAVLHTPWEMPTTSGGLPQAPEQVPEEIRGLVAAGAVYWHSEWVQSHVRGMQPLQERTALLRQATVTGRTIYDTVGDMWRRGHRETSVATVLHHSREVGEAARRMVLRAVAAAPQATPGQVGQLAYIRAESNMADYEYSATDWHRVLRQLGADANHATADQDEAAHRVQAMLHHFSDTYEAPPAAVQTPTQQRLLADFTRRYQRWVTQAGIPPSDASRQLVERLLQGDLSFRHLLASYPEREDELRTQVTEHLFGMFMAVASGQLPHKGAAPRPRDGADAPEGRARAPRKRTAAAAGSVAVSAGAPAGRPAPAKKAAPAAKTAAPKKVAKTTKAGKASAADAAEAAAMAGEDTVDIGEFVDDHDAATAAGAAGVADVFDFRSAEDIAADEEAFLEAKGFDLWTISTETEDGYAEAQTKGIMTTDNVRVYLREIGKTPLLNAEQEVELAKAIEAGVLAEEAADALYAECSGRLSKLSPADRKLYLDYRTLQHAGERATTLFLQANLRLVVSIAKRYKGRGMGFLDLIQEGNMGLIRAVQKFDYTRGYKFSTYATWWIRQALTRSLADQARTIRIPVHMVEKVNKMARIQRELLQELQREPSPEEIAEEMGLETEEVLKIIEASRETVSLDRAVGDNPDDSALGDFIADKGQTTAGYDSAAADEQTRQVEEVLATLPERTADIIRRRMGLFDGHIWTLDEIGPIHGITRERVRQLEQKGLAALRDGRSRHLRDHLRE
jgi:RNA polymerase primary sigma factor